MVIITPEIKIAPKILKTILHDAEKSAKAVNLIYVNDQQAGISRIKKGKGFTYILGKNKLTETAELERIKKLVIPPAWQNVWICADANGHLQVTGTDARNRKQYKYHPLWNSLRNHTKFYRLHAFGKVLPEIRLQLEQDLSLPGLPLQKVLATVVSLMEQTSIRIGNSAYEKLYGSFGLTTLKDQHVKMQGANIQFAFKGKKGVAHNISIKSKRLAKIVKSCRDIPGKELFQYYDHDGNRHSIDSGMVNNYIKTLSGTDFTAKDFRTWAGTVHAISAFKEVSNGVTKTDIKNNIVAVLDVVAAHLGNTRTVCKKYYVHPALLALYENNQLDKYLQQLDKKTKTKVLQKLSAEETLLMVILEKEGLLCK